MGFMLGFIERLGGLFLGFIGGAVMFGWVLPWLGEKFNEWRSAAKPHDE